MAPRKVPFDLAAYETGVLIAEAELLMTCAGAAVSPQHSPATPASDQAAARAADMAKGMAIEALRQLYALEGAPIVLEVATWVTRHFTALQAQKTGVKS